MTAVNVPPATPRASSRAQTPESHPARTSAVTLLVIAGLCGLGVFVWAFFDQAQAQTPSVRIQVNFSDAATAPPAGWVSDAGDPYGVRASGETYGWLDSGTLQPLDLTGLGRNRAPTPDNDVLRESLVHMQDPGGAGPEGVWEIDLANGDYQVIVQVGDVLPEGIADTRHVVRAEGLTVVDFPQSVGGYGIRNGSMDVSVSDGKLTLDSLGGVNTKIHLVVIESTDGLSTPAVLDSTPADGADAVPGDTSISANFLDLPNPSANGATSLDNTTITTANVQLFEVTAAGEVLVPSSVNGTGGGDAINLSPTDPLKPLTKYRFTLRNVRDLAGAEILPFSMEFTTDSAPVVPNPLDGVGFVNVGAVTDVGRFTSLDIGPDGRLYGLALGGSIHRWEINADGTLGARQVQSVLKDTYGGRFAIGFAFAPDATADNMVAYVTHSALVYSDAPDWDGKISRLTGDRLQHEKLLVTGLPRSVRDHLTNSVAFDEADPNLLYLTQGSNSAGGDADGPWGNRPERLLSAAVLRLDLSKLTTTPLDVQTSTDQAVINAATTTSATMSDGTYNPYYTEAPLTLYATGVRNAYDLVWHSNGQLYVPTNGTAGGSLAPASVAGTRRPDGSVYSGPAIPAVGPNETQRDWLFRIDPASPGGYYGHPNPTRGEYVMNRGKVDVDFYDDTVQPDANFRGAAFDFDFNKSPNGVIEYHSNAHGGDLQGALLVVRYSAGSDVIALVPDGPNGDVDTFKVGIPGINKMTDPLDLVEDRRNGNLYVSDFGTGEILLIKPEIAGTAAEIEIENMTKLPASATVATSVSFPADDYFTFSKIRDLEPGQQFHTTNTMRITNPGVDPLVIDQMPISNYAHFDLPNGEDDNLPLIVAPGGSHDLVIELVESVGSKGNRVETIELHSNAANDPIFTATLNGLYAVKPEGGNEPNSQQIMDAFGFTTSMNGVVKPSSDYPLPADVAAGVHGDLVVSELWEVANPNKPVHAVRLASYQGPFNSSIRFIDTPDSANPNASVGGIAFTFDVDWHQSLLSRSQGSALVIDGDTSYAVNGEFRITSGGYTTSGRGSVDPGTGLRPVLGVRMYQAYDRNGDSIDNAYILMQDYVNDGCTSGSGQCDWNDNMAYFTNIKPVSPPPIPCGGYDQEAEDGVLVGNMAIATDATASGGSYVTTPASGPNLYTFDPANYVEFCVNVTEAGEHRIDTVVNSLTSGSDSFWVEVDDGGPKRWNYGIKNGWTLDPAAENGVADPLLPVLSAGQHTIRFYQRESGAQLDKFTLVPIAPPTGPTCVGLTQEAEFGVTVGSMTVLDDSTASGGQYVGAPFNGPNFNIFNDANYAEYCVTVDEAGTYRLEGDVLTPDNRSDSFFVQMDDDPESKWYTGLNPTWTTDAAGVTVTADPTEYELTTGDHILRVYQRESGARLDAFELVLVPPPTEVTSATCAGLSQEAEQGAVVGTMAIQSDATASGGEFVGAPGSLGNTYTFDDSNYLEVCFTITTAGDYEIAADVLTPTSGSDSFWVEVDGDRQRTWHAGRHLSWESDRAAETGVEDPMRVTWSAGDHIVRFYQRESGAMIDTVTAVLIPSGPTPCLGAVQEAEDGVAFGTMAQGADATASNGAYVGAPGTGPNRYIFDAANYVEFCFGAVAAGTYQLDVTLLTPSASADSFFVEVDGAAPVTWHAGAKTTWTVDQAAATGIEDPLVLDWAAGDHIVRFYQRESGALIDKIALVAIG